MEKITNIELKLIKYLRGQADGYEKGEVERWINQSPSNRFEFEKLKSFWAKEIIDPKTIHHEYLKHKIWQKHLEESNANAVQIKTWKNYWRAIAASTIIVLAASFMFYLFRAENTTEVYEEAVQVEKINPIGQKSQIQLPDGSKVWLNADSKITYPVEFSDSIRTIELIGEAFFEVVKDQERPFIVHADGLEVKVLGTSFNVEAYKGNNQIGVTLLEGVVKVVAPHQLIGKEHKLTPGKGLVYSKLKNSFKPYTKESNEDLFNKATEWRNGLLVFDGDDLSGFIEQITRWYGVEVSIKGSPKGTWQLKGTFKNEYLTNILDVISYNKDFEYELDNKKLTLIFN